MDKIFILILAGFILLSVITYQYNPAQQLSIEQVCDSSTSVCANCPLFQQPDYSYDINAYAYLLHNNPFSALVSTSNATFRKGVCKNYLPIINSSLNIQPNQYISQYLKEGKIMEKHSFFLEYPKFMKHTMLLNKAKDFIIFTKQSNSKPVAYVQKARNADNLLRYSRIIGWSILIILIISYASLQIGLSLFTIDQCSKPLLEMSAIIFSIYCSNDSQFFEYFPLVQALYLTVIYVRLSSQLNKSKFFSTVWLIICVFYPHMVVVGQIYLGYTFLRTATTNSIQTNSVGLLILIGILTKGLQLLIPLNFFTFFHILGTIIFLPLAFLIIQTKLSRDNPTRNAK